MAHFGVLINISINAISSVLHIYSTALKLSLDRITRKFQIQKALMLLGMLDVISKTHVQWLQENCVDNEKINCDLEGIQKPFR